MALVRNRHSWASGRRRWYWPIALFIAGSVVDAAFAPSDTLVGPTLVAIWCGATAAHRDEWVSMFALAAAFALATILAIAVPAALPLPDDNGGVVRAAALGLLLLTAGAPRARRARKPRPPRSVGRV